MNIVCASICYRGFADDEVAATLERASAIGYTLMEIHGPLGGGISETAPDALRSLKAKIAAAGMRCAGIYPCGWGGRDDAAVRESAAKIVKAVAAARELGADHLAMTSNSAKGEAGAIDRIIACIRLALEGIGKESSVRLCLEPHLGNALEQEADFAAVMRAVGDPRVGLCVDTGHFHAAHVDTLGFIRRHGRRIYNVHFKDHVGEVSVGIGRGEIDLASVIAALRAARYAGDLTLELEVQDPANLPRYTEEAYFYVSGLLGRRLDPRK